jgi:hypothetical protein
VTVSISGTANAADLNFTGYTGTFNTSFNTLNVFGSLTLASGATYDQFGTWNFKSTATGKTLTTAGKSLPNVNFNGVGGGWTVQDSLNIPNRQLRLDAGALDLNGKVFNFDSVTASVVTTSVRSFTTGASTMTSATGGFDFSGTTNLSVNGTGSTLVYSGTGDLNFGGFTWGEVQFNTPSSAFFLNVNGGGSFSNFKFLAGAAQDIRFDSSTYNISGTVTLTGTAGNVISISGGSWVKTTGTVTASYASITSNLASGGAIWDASNGTNTDGGGNTGWIFTVASASFNPWQFFTF